MCGLRPTRAEQQSPPSGDIGPKGTSAPEEPRTEERKLMAGIRAVHAAHTCEVISRGHVSLALRHARLGPA